MGGSQTKQVQAPTFVTPDISKAQGATFSGEYLSSLAQQNAAAAQQAIEEANRVAAEAVSSLWRTRLYIGVGIVGIVILIILGLIFYDLYARNNGLRTYILPGVIQKFTNPDGTDTSKLLDTLNKATQSISDQANTVTSSDAYKTASDTTSSLYNQASTAASGVSDQASSLYNQASTAASGEASSLYNQAASEIATPAIAKGQQPPPPYLWSWVFGEGMLPGPQDTTTSTFVTATSAPLSAVSTGSYGMQWWMYVKDWNYGYGKEKPVVVRSDPMVAMIQNPRVVLHPTDNTLRISISVFPADNSSASNEPSSYGDSNSNGDVFICEVPNIPLQSWFSVSLTVFDRNLDVYIDGKLVKSCFISGVPKPATGNIQISPNGGYSGLLCNFQYSNSSLSPTDAATFFSKDTACRAETANVTSLAADTTGYAVKFGLYDTLGKTIKEYTF